LAPEIAENLHRRELSALERDTLRAAWVRLRSASEKLAQDGPVSKRGRQEGRGNSGGVRQSARDLGVPRPSLERSLKVAALPPETKARAVELGLADNQAALLEATKAAGSAAVTFSPSASRRSTSSRIVSSVLGAAREKRASRESLSNPIAFCGSKFSWTWMKRLACGSERFSRPFTQAANPPPRLYLCRSLAFARLSPIRHAETAVVISMSRASVSPLSIVRRRIATP
jgi:ParB family chromosome partitioning protein